MPHKKIAQAILGVCACLLAVACAPTPQPAAVPPSAAPATATPTFVFPTHTPTATLSELDLNYWLSHQDDVFWLGWSADGRRLVASAGSGVYIFDLQSGAATHLPGSKDFGYPMALDPQGKRMETGNKVWDLASGRELYTLPVKDLSGGRFSPDGATLALGGSNDITLWDAATGKLRKSVGSGLGDIEVLAFSADEMALYALANNREVRWLDLSGSQAAKQLSLPEGACCIAFSDDARYMLVNLPNHGVGTKELWDVQKDVRLIDIGHCDDDSIVHAFSRDGRFFASGPCYDSQQAAFVVQIWDRQAGRLLHQIATVPVPGFDPDWSSATFSPDGAKIALGDGIGRVTIWSLSDFALLQTLKLK